MKMTKMLKIITQKFQTEQEQNVPVHIQQAVEKMDITISRLAKTTNVNLFKSDYLE